MSVLQNSSLDLDIFYKKTDLPNISLGDKVKVTIYLELPKQVEEGQKKGERTYSGFRRRCNFEAFSKH
jgi:hypothetical protein